MTDKLKTQNVTEEEKKQSNNIAKRIEFDLFLQDQADRIQKLEEEKEQQSQDIERLQKEKEILFQSLKTLEETVRQMNEQSTRYESAPEGSLEEGVDYLWRLPVRLGEKTDYRHFLYRDQLEAWIEKFSNFNDEFQFVFNDCCIELGEPEQVMLNQ